MIDFSCKHDIWIDNGDGTLSRMDEPYFKSWKLADGVWRVLSSGDWSYLVEGDDEALAIDSGYGAGNIREYMQTLTDKPVRRIANTHDHFDHTANNSYFEMVYMAEASVPLATRPFPSFAGIDFPCDYPVTVLQNGDIIRFGTNYECLLILIDTKETGLKVSEGFIPTETDAYASDEDSAPILYQRLDNPSARGTIAMDGSPVVDDNKHHTVSM